MLMSLYPHQDDPTLLPSLTKTTRQAQAAVPRSVPRAWGHASPYSLFWVLPVLDEPLVTLNP